MGVRSNSRSPAQQVRLDSQCRQIGRTVRGGALSENVIAQGYGSGEAVGGGGKPAGAGGDLVTGFAHSEANCPAQE